MPIADVDVPGSDGWWMKTLARKLREKQPRLARLENYRRGTPPHPSGTEHLSTEPLYRFHKQCRSNFADLVVRARVERLGIRSVRTAAANDDDGDGVISKLMQMSGMKVALADLFGMVGTFGEGMLSSSEPPAGSTWPKIRAEDPREVIVEEDADGRPIAAFKLYHDDTVHVDYAILWRPGRKVVAVRKRTARAGLLNSRGQVVEPRISFSPAGFDLQPERPDGDEIVDGLGLPPDMLLWSEEYDLKDLPVRRVTARDCVGVFELHTDLLDRINHMILQRVVIATLQAFRQRAIELTEDLPKYDEDNKEIDYNDLFAADPGALWRLPVGAKIWESGGVDLTGILSSVKDDVLHFGSVTRTPFSMFSSDAVNQSAQGAQLIREGLVFAVEDMREVATQPLLELLGVAVQLLPDDLRYTEGDDGTQVDRADVAGMAIDWLPAERYSLAEKAQADAQAVSRSRRGRLRDIWGLTPAEIDIEMAQAAEDALLGTTPARPANAVSSDSALLPAG